MNDRQPPEPRKRPKQSRSQMLVNSIQQACRQILEQEGPDQLTTQRIADVAGINIASLYQYFPNKEAILAEVFEQQIAEYTRIARQRLPQIQQLASTSLEQTLAAIIEMEIEQHLMLQRMDPNFYRDYQHSFDVHQRIDNLTLSLSNPGWDEWFPAFLQQHRQRLRNVAIEVLSKTASHALLGAMQSALVNDPALLEQASFKQELYQMLLRYLCK